MSFPDVKPLSFVEFAKRKLEQHEYHLIKTNVIIDGMILSDKLAQVQTEQESKEDVESVESFVKVQMEGSLSSASISTVALQRSSRPNLQDEAGEDKMLDVIIVADKDTSRRDVDEDYLSSATEPGTLRSTIKTFKSRSQQTMPASKPEEDAFPKGIPARFEGTMLTPVFFEGRMLTPEKLDEMLAEAAKKKNTLTIPVSFEGGMLTAAFRSIKQSTESATKIDKEGEVAVPVRFAGRLQGILGSESESKSQGVPITFDGTMAAKSGKNKHA
ncbi:hypothetical protein PoB_003170300 [Plakobranchus ocellatus]|uniref:Uncharacterized protein n=1 Tax=Plakobranchus ocellatus TaxID=259542 RepID=A0AAV4AD59_9GAST|nr:hypothetical protein PoB_003170300 [Plakobranchus ocellatus]